MIFAPAAHVLNGPLDAFVELLLPVLIVAGLYWWSKRAEKKAAKKRGEGPQ